MKTPKTDKFIADLRKMCKIAQKNSQKSCKIHKKQAERLVKEAQMRVFIKNLRDYAETVAKINEKKA